MTDARASRYDELYPALDGRDTTNLLNNNNSTNSWSAHQPQNKLNYIQQIQNLYHQNHDQQVLSHLVESQQQAQQQQHQQQPQPQQQQTQHHQQQFLTNNTAMQTNDFSAPPPPPPPQQQQHQHQQQPQPQQPLQAKRPGAGNHPMLSERFVTFKIAPEERRHRDLEQSKILKEIMQKTNTKIEVTTTKDGSLNFCVIGKENNNNTAKNLVLNEFQQGVTLSISVPRAIYGRLLGPKGQRLSTIQDETQTKITIPRRDEDSDIIKIVGLKNNAELAVRAIEKCAREFAGKAVEKVTVERIYILFITGPFNENLKRWEEMGAKVSTSGGLLPSNNDRESGHADEVTFTIVGEVNAVNQVKDEIIRTYEDKKKKCTTVNIEVKKAQHKYILGPLGQNLRQLFAKTGVSVELPHESESETITLRGERSKLGPALSELYNQAHSETDDFFEVESWLHKYLIGPKKTNFLDFKVLGVEVKSLDDKIKLHGPPTEIENILDIFESELQQLKKNIIRKDIKVEPRIHGYIIGKAGATVDQIREESGANIMVPKNDEPSEFISLEGTREAIAIAEEKINAIAKRYEASRKLVIDQQLLGLIIGRGGDKIRSIREKFSQVVFSFPDMSSRQNEITIVGPIEEVEECYKYLDELHQQIQVNNHQVQVPIKKEVLKFMSDAKPSIRRLKIDHQVKIDLFVDEFSPAANATDDQKKDKEAPAAKAGDDTKKKGGKNADGNQSKGKQPNGVADNKAKNESTDGGKQGNLGNYAIIIGKKENVELVKPKLIKLLDEFASTTEIEVKIASNLRENLGPKSRLYRQYLDDFQNKISITFPRAIKQQQQVAGDEPAASSEVANGNSNKEKKKENRKGGKEQQVDDNKVSLETVKIRGPKSIIKKAEKQFEALIAECQKNFTIKFNVDAAVYDKFGRSDKLSLKAIRDTHNVKLHIPDKREGVKQQVCTIVGHEKDAQEARKQFEKLMKDVAERVEETIEIPSQLHPRLIGTGGRAVKKLMEEHKIHVKFARPGDVNPNAVTLSGRRKNVDSAASFMQKTASHYMSMENKNAASGADAGQNELNQAAGDDVNNGNINNEENQLNKEN